jgi:hypothetical protein
MTAHQSTGVVVIERFTQDGYDWPNGHHDERCWPLPGKREARGGGAVWEPMADYFREQQRPE